MRHASTRRPLVAGQPTLSQRVFAVANDSLMPVTVNAAASRKGQQSAMSRPSAAAALWSAGELIAIGLAIADNNAAIRWIKTDKLVDASDHSRLHLPAAAINGDWSQCPGQPEANPFAAQRGGVDLQHAEVLAGGPNPDRAADRGA